MTLIMPAGMVKKRATNRLRKVGLAVGAVEKWTSPRAFWKQW